MRGIVDYCLRYIFGFLLKCSASVAVEINSEMHSAQTWSYGYSEAEMADDIDNCIRIS